MKKINFQNIAVILKPEVISEFYNLLPNLKLWLERRKKNIVFFEGEVNRLNKIFRPKDLENIKFLPLNDIFKTSDLIISLGGDGTLLGVCRHLLNSSIPVFGVNLGHLGFLTEFNKNDFFENLDRFFDGKLETVKEGTFKVQVERNQKIRFRENFVNDVVIAKKDIARMFTLKVDSETELIYNVSGDGLIISSPLGSTAYSLAAGGPIIHPEVRSLILTPICAHGLTHRPLVVPDTLKLSVKPINQEDNILLTLDGQVAINIDSKDIVKISKDSRKFITLVKNPERNFFHTLKEKFNYGRRDI